jgi:RNA polymerase sigma-70 factor (ECF subfamily)
MRGFLGNTGCGDFGQLLDRAQSGDDDARGRVLQYFWLALLQDARRDLPWDLRQKVGGSDLVQEAMLDAHKRFDQFTGRTAEEFYLWLRCLLRHKFSDFARAYRTRAKRQVRREVPLFTVSDQFDVDERRPAPESPPDEAIHRESRDRYFRAVERAPDEIRELIRLRFDERLTYSDIGERMGFTAEAARKLLTRTLRLLGDELAD